MKKITLLLALFLLAGVGYANDHFRERIERVTKKHESGSNFNFEQRLNTNENWTSHPEKLSAPDKSTPQNIQSFDVVAQDLTLINCTDQANTNANAAPVFYKVTQRFTTGSGFNIRIDSLEYAIYNGTTLAEIRRFMVRTGGVDADIVNLRYFTQQLYTTNQDREFTFSIRYFDGPRAPENRRMKWIAVDELGNLLHTFDSTELLVPFRNASVRRVITMDEIDPARIDQVLLNTDTTTFRLWSITGGTPANTTKTQTAEHRIGSKNLVAFDAPMLDIRTINGTAYYYIPHYEQPYNVGAPGLNQSTPNNTGIIEFFNFSNGNSWKRIELPATTWTPFQVFNIAIDFYDQNFTQGVYSQSGLDVLYGVGHYVIACDCYQYTYHVINEDGTNLRNFETRTDGNARKLKDITGQNPVYSLLWGGGQGIIMFDPITWSTVTEFMAVHHGEKLTIDYNRIPYGNDYAFIFGMEALVTEGGTRYGQINYYDKNGNKVRNLRFDVGNLALAFYPMLSNTALNPYIVNVDSKMEFITLAPRRVSAGSDQTIQRLHIYNEDGDFLYNVESSGTQILSGAGLTSVDNGRTFSYFNLIFRDAQWNYTNNFYRLPFDDAFDGGDGGETNPYLISDAGQLNNIRNETWAHYKIINDIDMKPFIDANGWTAIPNFTGTLDGQNFAIKNLSLTSTGQHTALFGTTGGASVIQNLRIEDAHISANSSSTNVAFLVGDAGGTALIRNVHVTGSITFTSAMTSATANVGTIVANMMGSGVVGAMVDQCSFEGVIESPSTFAISPYIGGIAGSMRTTATVRNSVSRGRIHIPTRTSNSGIGGIVGSMRTICYVTNCYSEMNITSTNRVGGVVGGFETNQNTKGTIQNCYATGRIIATGTIASSAHAGGVVGWTSENNENASLNFTTFEMELNRVRLNMKGLIALNDTVTGLSARRVSSPQIPGFTADFGIQTSDSIVDCYALSTMRIGAASVESTVTPNPAVENSYFYDGLNIPEFTEAFLTSIGWQFGTDADNPWVWMEGGNPMLWFELLVTAVELNEDEVALYTEETIQLIATVYPETALNQNVTWTSSDETIATVVDGLVTAIAVGTAIITVTTEEGGHTATCEVTVSPATFTITASVNGVGGTITPSGEITVANGSEQKFTYTADEGYELTQVLIDGEASFLALSQGEYIFWNVEQDHTIEVFFTEASSIQDVVNEKVFTVYPNPIKDELHIQTEKTITQIVVLELNGKTMKTWFGNQRILDVQFLKTGSYILRIHTENAVVPIQIVKQ
ncbi:MAG: Ig-like domain-containing protein [Bacteroidales bacterium]|nr:Ig-like domain-containing protein [Bacteroidales bacterium]